MALNKEKKPSYTASDIYVLEGLEPVRKRPGMYIGSTGVEGLHHLIWEVFDNSLDEAMAGHAQNIIVTLQKGNRVSVKDDGRGIPVEKHKQTGVSALETVMTTLHAGGKFGGEAYKIAGGLHGVGVSVVNALSVWMKAEVVREGVLYEQEYKRGIPVKAVKKVGMTKEHTGTTVTFEPDSEIFKEIRYDWDVILNHLRQQAYLTKGARISIIDERNPVEAAKVKEGSFGGDSQFPSHTFYFEGGIVSYVGFLNRGMEPKHKEVFYTAKEQQNMFVEIALQYVDDLQARDISFANNIHTVEGGMHMTGFKAAITRTLNDYARKNGFLKEKEDNLTGDDVREGLTAIVSVKIMSKELQFEGQTKAKLGNPEARTTVEAVMNTEFADWLERNPVDARQIMDKVILASKARMAAKAARETVLRKGALEGMTLPGKLADCSSRDASESELFIVEGDSAGGCFSGDTKVALTDGRDITFKELVKEYQSGKKNFCYTIAPDGNVAIAPISEPRITRRNAEVIKVILDNGEEITCTPDHKFMLRDGTYQEAAILAKGNSLMPLYRKVSKIGGQITIDGYEMVYNPAERYWRFTHMIADAYNLSHKVYAVADRDIRHHKDFNKRNNNPDNIVRMDKQVHLLYHTHHLEKTAFRPEVLEKLRRIKQSPEYREKIRKTMMEPGMRALLSARAKKQWENEEYKKYMTQKFLEFYRSSEEYRASNNELLNRVQKEYWSSPGHRQIQANRVRKFFTDHPERREILKQLAHREWSDSALRAWRAEETKKQWTPEFRAKRKTAYNSTYFVHTIQYMKQLLNHGLALEEYDQERVKTGNRNLLRSDTFCERFFQGDKGRMVEAVQHHNHKVVRTEKLPQRIDVYDFEVPGTHSFALASGVFVHNSSKMGRDRRIQAILPLRGKILNVEKARIDKILASEQVRNLIIAMGTAIAEEFDIAKLRYHKVVIMTDADVDGAHIRTLLLTLFYRYFPQLINAGHIYIAQPPLYRIQKGSVAQYAYSDGDKEKIIEQLTGQMRERAKEKTAKASKNGKAAGLPAQAGEWEVTPLDGPSAGSGQAPSAGSPRGDSVEPGRDGRAGGQEAEEGNSEVNKISGLAIQRYKGLGEMNAEQLWDTTMNPESRVLYQVTVSDAEEANRTFDVLMGADVLPRKKFIQTHAKSVQNLDI